jgi:hypothetical protein
MENFWERRRRHPIGRKRSGDRSKQRGVFLLQAYRRHGVDGLRLLGRNGNKFQIYRPNTALRSGLTFLHTDIERKKVRAACQYFGQRPEPDAISARARAKAPGILRAD